VYGPLGLFMERIVATFHPLGGSKKDIPRYAQILLVMNWINPHCIEDIMSWCALKRFHLDVIIPESFRLSEMFSFMRIIYFNQCRLLISLDKLEEKLCFIRKDPLAFRSHPESHLTTSRLMKMDCYFIDGNRFSPTIGFLPSRCSLLKNFLQQQICKSPHSEFDCRDTFKELKRLIDLAVNDAQNPCDFKTASSLMSYVTDH
jgi:hypothetical protein